MGALTHQLMEDGIGTAQRTHRSRREVDQYSVTQYAGLRYTRPFYFLDLWNSAPHPLILRAIIQIRLDTRSTLFAGIRAKELKAAFGLATPAICSKTVPGTHQPLAHQFAAMRTRARIDAGLDPVFVIGGRILPNLHLQREAVPRPTRSPLQATPHGAGSRIPLQCGRELLTMSNPVQKQQRIQRVRLATGIGTNQYRERIDVQRRYPVAFPVPELECGNHGSTSSPLGQAASMHHAIPACRSSHQPTRKPTNTTGRQATSHPAPAYHWRLKRRKPAHCMFFCSCWANLSVKPNGRPGGISVPQRQTGDTVFVSTNACKCSYSSFGICPPVRSTPASMFCSIAWPVRLALVMKHMSSSATTTLA